MNELSVVVSINVKSNGSGEKKFRLIEGPNVIIDKYEVKRLVDNIFAVKYNDDNLKLLDIEIIKENGDSITLASLKLNEETEQLIAKFADMSAAELLVNIAKYRSGEM